VVHTGVAVCRWRSNNENHCYTIAPLYDSSYSVRGKIQEMVSIGEANLVSTPPALASRRLFSLAIAPDGAVWVATDKNLVCFDGQDWHSYDITQAKYISEMEIAPDGSIWAITSQTEARQEDSDPSARMMRISVERLRPSVFDTTCRWIGP
jgi:hypothetical protein